MSNVVKFKELDREDKTGIIGKVEAVEYEATVSFIVDTYGVCDRSARGWISRIRKEG